MADREIRIVLQGDASGAVKAAKDAERELGHLDLRLQNVTTRSIAVGAALGQVLVQGAGRAIGAAKELATAYADAGSMVYDLSKRTGFSSQALSEWKYAADQSGTSIEGLEVGIRKMNSAVVAAVDGSKEQIASLAAVGVTVEELRGKRPEQVFEVIAAGLAGVDDEARQSALATELFGRSGTQLLPILKDGATNIAAMRAEAKALGITFSEEDAAAADKFGDELGRMNKAIEGVKIQIGRELLPVLEPMVREFADFVAQNGPQMARDLGAALGGVAETTKDISADLKAIAGFGPIKLALDVVAKQEGDVVAWTVLGGMVGAKFGPLGAIGGAALGFVGSSIPGWAEAQAKSPQRELETLVAEINKDSGQRKQWSSWSTATQNGSATLEQRLAKAREIAGIAPPPAGGWFTTPGSGSGLVNEQLLAEQANAIHMRRPGLDTSGGTGGGGGAKEDPIVTAWKAIHAELQREQQRALMEGGQAQLAEVKFAQDEIVRATQEMAERAHQAIGIDMADALKAAFDFMRDQAKDSAKALEEYADALKKTAEAEAALAAKRRQDAFELTKTLWGNAGGGLSTAGAQELARAANLATQMDSIAQRAIAMGATPEQAADLANGHAASQQQQPVTEVKVTLSGDLAVAGEP